MILDKEAKNFKSYTTKTFISLKQLMKLLEKRKAFRNDLIKIFKIEENQTEIIKVGNAKQLVDSLFLLDNQCEKIDIDVKVKNIYIKRMLEDEKALFDIFEVSDDFILKENKSDLLTAETRYSAKNDILDYYNFSKFANYCRDKEFEDLINTIRDYLRKKNSDNKDKIKLRLLFKNDDRKFFLRAMTSSEVYKDFGINFSVFVALITLGRYVDSSQNEIYIDNFVADDSNIYVSFSLTNKIQVDKNTSLTVSIILENNEIKRGAVSFNGVFKLQFIDSEQESAIYLKPKGIKRENSYPVDLLNYPHKGSVEKVFEKIEDLPKFIELFIKQVHEDAPKIAAIQNPDDVRKLISNKVKFSKKPEFKEYKDKVFKKLMSMTVDNTFKLFELLRQVEELFEHEDVISRDFWRTKLYEALIEKK
ncbi:MAG: hypothetical protein ACPGVB_08635 [Chitinophagales bacterium]